MRKLGVILGMLFSIMVSAQDVHFSQFSATSFLLNPALVGSQNSTYKATLQRKSQWQSVSVPFNTFSLAIERKSILPTHNIGAQFLNDIAGDSRFRTTGVNLAYAKKVPTKGVNNFTLGLQLGVFQRAVEFDNLIFNDPENLINVNFMFFDIAVGVANYYKYNERLDFETGVAVYHLNKAKQSITQDDKIRLHQKINLHFGGIYDINKQWQIHPKFLASNQDKDREILLACDVNYIFDSSKKGMLKSGVAMRMNDAFIYSFGAALNDFTAIVSYDINTSSLANASGGKGGFEFVVVYRWSIESKKKVIKSTICPKYL